MNDYYLKAETEQTLMAALDAAGLIVEGVVVRASQVHALDIVGVVYEPTGNTLTDDEGTEFPEMAPVAGFHANYRGEDLPEALVPLAIPAPSSPARVWL